MVHVLHQTPQGAPVFTTGEKVAEEMEELRAGEGEKVGGGVFPWGVERVGESGGEGSERRGGGSVKGGKGDCEYDADVVLRNRRFGKTSLVRLRARICMSIWRRRGRRRSF